MSENTVRSQVRFSEKRDEDVPAPLFTLAEVKAYFGVVDTALDAPLTTALNIVSAVIRSYTGRTLSKGNYTEVFTDVSQPKTERYLVEIPIDIITAPEGVQGVQLMNRATGRIEMISGPEVVIEYIGGYDPLPAELVGVGMELIRQQMAAMGYDTIGTGPPATAPQERAVTVGTLKVEYAISATSAQAKASGAGAMTFDALGPYSWILNGYMSYRKMVAT